MNIDSLRLGIADYRESLQRHVAMAREDFEELQLLWSALDASNEGGKGEELLGDWRRTAQWLEEYLTCSAALCEFLEERSEHLKSL